ncbi:ABC transporter permease [Flavimaricola marinus]|uniref:Glycine betaine transport system permease protein OpuAB n=1 Tax=Flavimaricola marinus TaxID=1819565 RepID=A0A238LCR6_9RHOB|nr:ABC transporter permease subunit [Flavimaricola marinus]SMY07517.1 Glycine betaine transport system permease protein OpuAB [Flavimaricola marinus]
MSLTSDTPLRLAPVNAWWRKPWLFWLALFVATWAFSTYSFALYKAFDARWIVRFPAALQLPTESWVSEALRWLVEDASFGLFTVRDLTRAISAAIEAPYTVVRSALATGFMDGQGSAANQIAPELSWIAVTVVMVALGRYAKDCGLALLVGACFVYLAVFGQWDSAMITLASVLIAVPLGAVGGLALGILAFRVPVVDRALRPLLDLMQTVPVFAYLVPILFLFGFGPVAALVATIIYAMPPMVRVTILALRGVPEEIVEAGRMVGCTRRQLMWKVLVPSATPTLMVGVNQVIMLTLNMVIIASMIGAGGLGFDVLSALRRLDIGGGIEAGLAIVVMAVALDRLSQAFARRAPTVLADPGQSYVKRHPWLITVLAVVVATYLAGLVMPGLRDYPESATLTTSAFWERAMEYVNVNYFDTFEAIKTTVLTYLLLPIKKFFTGIPWAWGIIAIGLAAWKIGGWRLGLMAVLMSGFIAFSGLWDKAMTTVYLCGASVLIAYVIGVPLGIWAGTNDRANAVLGTIVDTLQTLPSFVYLIPVVMLFRVGDFSAMIAVVLYALAPAVRYAAHGIRSIDPQMIEAGLVSGCTRRQLLWRIKLPLAAPEMLLGLNQTIMLALSMLVITALVGTRDLGQEVYIALTAANTGQGIVAGLSVAFIAIIADRIVSALAKRSEARLRAGA